MRTRGSSSSARAERAAGSAVEEAGERLAEREDAEPAAGVEEEDAPAQPPGLAAHGLAEGEEGLRRVHGLQQEPRLPGCLVDDGQLLGPRGRAAGSLIAVEQVDRLARHRDVEAEP